MKASEDREAHDLGSRIEKLIKGHTPTTIYLEITEGAFCAGCARIKIGKLLELIAEKYPQHRH